MFLRAVAILSLLLAVQQPAAAQDAAAGERVFAQCRACHQVGETAKNGLGPQLNDLWGRKSGTVAGYAYSPATKNADITWTPETFRPYIKDPKGIVPGTKMIYPGLKDDGRVSDLIAFLGQYDADGKKAQ
jgi:cytochrome c